eukprot:scaffold63538_cov87-Phaeocystis_antarctica.AAC.1
MIVYRPLFTYDDDDSFVCRGVSDPVRCPCPLRGSARGSRRCRAGGGTPTAVRAAGTRAGS